MSRKNYVCQSCGMPLNGEADLGTGIDGTSEPIYCKYCYQNCEFTEPSITIEEMADRCGGILSDLYGMNLVKARDFSFEQLKSLFRWSGKIIPICESCGMPLISPEDAGTEADGAISSNYCIHCFQNGSFVDPDLTREEMIARYAPMMAVRFEMPLDKAEEMIQVYVAGLPRWQ